MRLHTWLKTYRYSSEAFAAKMKPPVTRQAVDKWRKGAIPSRPHLRRISVVTKGMVKPTAWKLPKDYLNSR